jgi:hypothetical protein
LTTDPETRYGIPATQDAIARPASTIPNDRYSGADENSTPAADPFRQVSLRRLPTTNGGEIATSVSSTSNVPASGQRPAFQPTSLPTTERTSRKQVNARTFALEYELADVGGYGVSRVELWGTRDHGKSWRCFARDDDLRSPVNVSVDAEGLYGFRLLAESAGGAPVATPRPGDQPELWVEVDLHRPFAELTAVEQAAGQSSGQIVLRWKAEDQNLDPRPITLFYSSRPGGPWSIIAGELQNTGEFSWRVERHVPDRCYLRIEARDLAGNRGAFQTLEPITIELPQATAQLRAALPASDANAISLERPRQ